MVTLIYVIARLGVVVLQTCYAAPCATRMHPDIVVCELLAVEAVAGKDKLKKVTVTDGEKEFTVVSNAPNVLPEKVGKRIVVARVGAEVSGLDEPVKKANVGGVVSEGMLCDERMLRAVWKSNLRRVRRHRRDTARWRGDVGSSPLDGASAATSSPRNDLVKNPTHWLISTQAPGTAPGLNVADARRHAVPHECFFSALPRDAAQRGGRRRRGARRA